MKNIEKIENVFKEVGKKYGFTDVRVNFGEFKDFKMKWERTYDKMWLRVSDYLKGMPEEGWKDLAEAMFHQIHNNEVLDKPNFNKYVLSEEFRSKNMKEYLKRHAEMYEDTSGYLEDLLNNIENVPKGLKLMWSDNNFCSTYMRVIAFDQKLKDDNETIVKLLSKGIEQINLFS